MSIYYEKQRGDLCRLHSLNAYYGFKKFDDSEFFKLCAEYDEEIKGLKTQVMDGFSEGRCIISYVLDKLDNKYVFLTLEDGKQIFKRKYKKKSYDLRLNDDTASRIG